MDNATVQDAARLLVGARRERQPLAALPAQGRPQTFAEAHAIQQAAAALLGENVAAYKVAGTDPDSVMWGAILSSLVLHSPARFEAAAAPLLGMEGEIAFRLDRDIPAGGKDWTVARFDEAVTALPAIEIVATRFSDYAGTPILDRAADFMSNGALICGEPFPSWRSVDLSKIPAIMSFSGKRVAESIGGHVAGDPRLPAIAFLNAPVRTHTLAKGTIITTGTFTGLLFAKPGDTVVAEMGEVGTVRVDLSA